MLARMGPGAAMEPLKQCVPAADRSICGGRTSGGSRMTEEEDLDSEIVQEFLLESHEGLDQLEEDLLRLGSEADEDGALVASIFRTVHTMKGTAGALEYTRLESLSHVAENLLSRIRDGLFRPDRSVVDVLLSFGDTTRDLLTNVEANRSEGDIDVTALVRRIEELTERKLRERSNQAPAPAIPTATAAMEPQNGMLKVGPPPAGMSREKTGSSHEQTSDAQVTPSIAARAKQLVREVNPDTPTDAEEIGMIGEILLERGHITRQDLLLALKDQQQGDPRRVGEILVARGSVAPQRVKEAIEEQAERQQESRVAESIRVDVSLLDKLMNLVGELVLVRNQIEQYATEDQDRGFVTASHRLNVITSELQEGVMKTRMQPIGGVWTKFPRMVRHLSEVCAKRVRLEMEGKETELDRTIIEAIKDPLTHIVRNAVDHGLEDSHERTAAGKPEEGTVQLRAYHEGGQVHIEISDDGGGIDPARIRDKARDKGLVTDSQARDMSERELINLIFHPGFSTAEQVTNVSGRGVGMDVVKTNIERVGGAIDIESELGTGTTVRIQIPLTLAIIPVLIVTAGDERFALPQVSLLEVVRLEGDQTVTGIEHVHGAAVYRLRGRLLPIVHLDEQLELPPASDCDAVNIVVLQAGEHTFGLVVSEISDTAEIVVKPLSTQLKNIGVFSGATILGDGKVALILDVPGLARRANVLREALPAGVVEEQARAAGLHATEQLLVLGVGADQRLAVPLADVARLEEIPANDVELSQGQEVVQYRGDLLPLLRVAEAFGVVSQPPDPMQVFVYSHGDRSVGLVVDQVVDVVEDSVRRHELTAGQHGLTDTVILFDRVTDVFDVKRFVENRLPAFFEDAG